jgi:UDP-3-O-[3-hydroxymyristoyl] glucosamine N-acyltransferase
LIYPQSGITNNIPAKSIWVGSPAVPKRRFLEQQVQIKRLPRIAAELKELRQQVAALTEKLNALTPQG